MEKGRPEVAALFFPEVKNAKKRLVEVAVKDGKDFGNKYIIRESVASKLVSIQQQLDAAEAALKVTNE